MSDAATVNDGLALMEWDWFYNSTSTVLHHAILTSEQYAEWIDWAGLDDSVVTATCGRAVWNPHVPGVVSRMGMKRCDRCCDRLGYPRGVGSPKNDDDCRPLVENRLQRDKGLDKVATVMDDLIGDNPE